ncbi:MAG: hypothetical protein JWM36_145 [Hyphomicrobiales bacterium]|nr:hypothetical protein [Hyphomicrobiales bacterium]
MRHLWLIGLTTVLSPCRAMAADYMVCDIKTVYTFTENAEYLKGGLNGQNPDARSWKFRFDRSTGQVIGEFRYDGIVWSVSRKGDHQNSWILTGADDRQSLRYVLNIQTWIKGYPFFLTDVRLGDTNTGSCH